MVNGFPGLSSQDVTFDPLLDAGFDGTEVLQTSCTARNVRATPARQAGVRVTVSGDASRLAGALGAEFLPDQSGQLLIMVLASDLSGIDPPDAPLPGIPLSYGSRVLRAARATEEITALGAGVLRFDRAMLSPGESSPELFEWMASAVVRRLIPDLVGLPEDEFFALLGIGQLADGAPEGMAARIHGGKQDVVWLDDASPPPSEKVTADLPAPVTGPPPVMEPPPAAETPPAARKPDELAEPAFVFDDVLGALADQAADAEPPPENELASGLAGEWDERPEYEDDDASDIGEDDAEVDSVLAALLQAYYEERRGEPPNAAPVDFVLPAAEDTRLEEPDEETLSDLLSSLYGEIPQQEAAAAAAIDVETEWWVDPESDPAPDEPPGSEGASSMPPEFSPIFDDDV